MPFISPDDGYVTLFNIFETETYDGQERVVEEMRAIVDNASYPGWVSSTVHAGEDRPGTANYIQWRSLDDLEARYRGAAFQQKTVPLFDQLSTYVHRPVTEVVHAQHHPDQGSGPIEISPKRDDYTVLIVFRMEPENQSAFLDALAGPDEWLMTVPGYRSHTYLRGLDGTCVVNYAQWESKETYDRFHTMPEADRPRDIRQGRARARTLATSRRANTYRAVHTRSADD